MAVDIEARLRDELRSLADEHRSRVAAVDTTEPLAPNTMVRHAEATRTLLRGLLSSAPIGSPVAAEILAAEQKLCASQDLRGPMEETLRR